MADHDPTPIDLDAHDAAERAMTPGPWRECHASDSRCACGMIWSLPVDAVVASVKLPETFGDCTKNSDDAIGIVLLRNDHAAMVTELRTARARIAALEAAHHAICDELGVGFIAEDAHAAVRKLKALVDAGPLGGGIDEAVAARVAQLVAALDAACDGWRELVASDHGEQYMVAAIVEIDRIRGIAHPHITPVTP